MSKEIVKKEDVVSVQQLFENVELQIKKDQLMVFLNQQPPKEWLKKNPYANNALYVPIDKIEWMLNRFFGGYRVEILREGTMFNSMYVVIRLFYIDPISGKEVFQDGMGAKEVQTSAGSSPAQLENIKSGAVERGLPNAESNAIKDAAHKIGRVFGSDLNRKDLLPISTNKSLSDVKREKDIERFLAVIKNAKSVDDLTKGNVSIDDFPECLEAYNDRMSQLTKNK